MLSRLALKSGKLLALTKPQLNRGLVLSLARCNSSQSGGIGDLQKTLDNWDKANEIYYGKERDLQNFPHPKQPETAPPTRMGVLPETWFKMFYDKTGVTGPYVFGFTTLTFLLSKEYWVIEHQFVEFLSFWIAVGYLIKKVGPGISKAYDQYNQEYLTNRWESPINQIKESAQTAITETEKALWREEGKKYLFEAKRECVDLQLEGAYRQQQNAVYQAVKKRLDYHVSIDRSKKNFQQQHMVNWIVDGVVAGITPQQEKANLKKCIADLKTMAAHA